MNTKFKNVKEGDMITVRRMDGLQNGHKHFYNSDWLVESVYQDYVLCSQGIRHECFCYGELVQLGYEKQNINDFYAERRWSHRYSA